MPQEPFPHILTFPKDFSIMEGKKKVSVMQRELTSNPQRVVSPSLKEGDIIPLNVVHPHGIRFKITKIVSCRPAKGDWSKWPKHPNHYEVEMKLA